MKNPINCSSPTVPPVGLVLDMLAFAGGKPERRVSVPLRVEKGVMYLGPVRIGTLASPASEETLGPAEMMP